MFRNLAVIALLLQPITEAVKVQIDNYPDWQERMIQEEAELLSQVGNVDESCMGGIKRWSDPSNSGATFSSANAASSKWEDPSFPADTSSLYWKNFLPNAHKTIKEFTKMTSWQRPTQLVTSPSLYGTVGKPIPLGVSQGRIGDCWFLASAAAAAEVSSRIEDVITNKAYDKNGIFRFKFWQNGQWHHVNVDDRIPTMKWRPKDLPFGDRESQKKAWWMPLMEKAYAKFDQTYERIEGGSGLEGLHVLTGAPVHRIRPHRTGTSALWTKLQYLSGKNFPMTAGCNVKIDGLISGHAYSFLDAVQLKGGPKIVQVRNPWSKEKYKGPFNDDSSSWTAAWKKQVNLKAANDGKFWLPLSTFQQAFDSLNVAYTETFASVENIHLNEKMHVWNYKIVNPVDQELFFTMDSNSYRNYPRTCRYGRRPLMPTVYFETPHGRTIQRAKSGYTGGNSCGSLEGQKIKAGTYRLYVVNWSYRHAPLDAHLIVSAVSLKPTISLTYKKASGW